MWPAPKRPALTVPLLTAALLLAAGLACNTLAGPRPAVAWDPDPAAIVVRATFCCGMVPMAVAQNYIPDVTVWGDGRIVWIDSDNAGARRVLSATLTPDQLTALLQQFVDAGFFGWDTNYGDYSITDGASQCLQVTLASTGHSVCEYYSGAPAKFHDLYTTASSGAGATGVEFVPEQAYVTAYPQSFSTPPTPDQYLVWPAESLGLSLANNAGGQWVTGDAAEFAWRVVNRSQWQPIVREGDDYYELTVLVADLSSMQPPTPPPAAP